MRERYTHLLDVSLQLAVEDVVSAASADKMDNLPELICYNIARHEDPTRLTPEQAERFVVKMKDLLGVHHVHRAMKT